MEPAELHYQWHENNDRPAWVRANRQEIMDAVDIDDPVPDGSLHDIRRWMDSYKSTVSRQLNELVDDADGGDSE